VEAGKNATMWDWLWPLVMIYAIDIVLFTRFIIAGTGLR
jgi:hypothetical protein